MLFDEGYLTNYRKLFYGVKYMYNYDINYIKIPDIFSKTV